MVNTIMLIGRIVSDLEINETKENRNVKTITLAITRSYKNINEEYDIDFIPVKLFGSIAENTTKYCKKGDLVGVKGRIERLAKEELTIIAEKISFLSTSKED